MDEFKAWIETSSCYSTLIFIHGERLFIQHDGVFDVLAIELAWQVWIYKQ